MLQPREVGLHHLEAGALEVTSHARSSLLTPLCGDTCQPPGGSGVPQVVKLLNIRKALNASSLHHRMESRE